MRSFAAASAFFLALVGLALLPSVGAADGCFKNRGFYSSYQSTFYTPSYSYAAPAYTPTYYPKVVEYLVNPDYYYSLNGYYRDKAQADQIVGRIAEMLLKGTPSSQPAPQIQPMQNLPPRPPEMEIKPIETPPVKNVPLASAGPHQDPRLAAVIQRSCANCHGSVPSKGASWPLLTLEGKLASLNRGQWYEAFSRVSTNNMPNGGKPLSDEETVLFLEAAVAAQKASR